ncbi:MAG TPA: M13 family metallopeptidase [Bacteroidota bacterium]|nr:M13 family metallopeptidase [Bacteroidota bacterium]
MTGVTKFIAGIAVAVSMCCALVVAQTHQTKPLDPANMDLTVKPSVDFNQYANGGWMKNNPIPADQSSWGAFNELREKNLNDMLTIVQEAENDKNATPGSISQKVGDLYYSGMDSVSIEAQGAKPLDGEMKKIDAINSVADLKAEIARLEMYNMEAPFGFGSGQDFKNSSAVIIQIGQGGLGLPEREYYLSTEADMQKTRDQYKDHVAKMLVLLGDNAMTAKAEADTIMAFETMLATASMKKEDARDPDKIYHKMTVAEANAITPNYSWSDYFKTVGLTTDAPVNVSTPDFFKAFNAMLTSEPLSTWKTYFRWHLLNAQASSLSSAFVQEDFNFKGTILSGQTAMRPRWKRMVGVVDRSVGEALGQLYVAKFFPPEAKEAARKMIENLRQALREKIASNTWMSDATKANARKKLDAFGVKVGYPDKWRDYSTLKIDRGPFVQNMLRIDQFEFAYDINKIGKPVDKTEWGMTPPTVNAYYTPLRNEIVFPAGILQPPFFDFHADDAVNYGGMGAVIGHEMSHGFDDQGRQFDEVGNLRDWWTSADSQKYTEQAEKIRKQFDGYIAIDSLHVNGKLTLGEDIGDFGGLTIAYAALQNDLKGKTVEKIDGFTPEQRFFLAWAQVWRTNMRPQALKLLVRTNPHAPANFRANGPLSNMPEFFKAFDVKEGDPMCRPAADRPKIW